MENAALVTTEGSEQVPNPFLKELTARQKEILDLIIRHIADTGSSPTYRELGRDAGISSLNGVSEALGVLHKKGWIRRTGQKTSRCYCLSAAALKLYPDTYNTPDVLFLKRQNNFITLKKLNSFVKNFPDNILVDLQKCETPQEGALIIINLVDDILCGDF